MNRKQRRAEQKQGSPGQSAVAGVQAMLSEALNHHQAGRLDVAEPLYQRAIALDPRNADALHLCGVLACQRGRPEQGAGLIARAIAINPAPANFHLNLANALNDLGRPREAAASFRHALAREPNHPLALRNLGAALQASGEAAEAIGLFEKALAVQPGDPETHNNLGNALLGLERREEAVASYERALALRPAYPVALNNMGSALRALGRLDEAETCFRRALDLKPDFAEALSNLGNIAEEGKRSEEAMDFYRQALARNPAMPNALYNFGNVLRHSGRLEEAVGCYRQALTLAPQDDRIWGNLGVALRGLGQLPESIEACAKAMSLAPKDAAAHDNLARSLHAAGRFGEAIDAYRRSLALKPDFIAPASNLADILGEQGRPEEAVAQLRSLLERFPDDPIVHAKLLFAAQYLPDATEQSLYAESLAWGDRHAPDAGTKPRFLNDRTPDRRLRVGYLSSDFKRHACAYFVHPLFVHHDRDVVEIFAYSEDTTPDEHTVAFRAVADHWRSVQGIDDADLEARIRADQIDILVHLSAHTAGTRLTLGASRPAPIQANWLGLGATSGVRAMDYFITDRFLVPDGAEAHFCEKVIRLPGCAYCYAPPEPSPETAPAPFRKAGHVTFGTLSRAVRLNERVLGVWARILNRVPSSRLIINTFAMSDPPTAERIRRFFAERGVAAERLELFCTRGMAAAFECYGRIDVALDPFPHNAGLTSYEALHMGVPVVTRADRPPQGRYGASILSNLGLSELIAWDDDAYVEIAVGLAQDQERLEALRLGMRERMQASPLRDAAAFARGMEEAYREMWLRWLREPQADA